MRIVKLFFLLFAIIINAQSGFEILNNKKKINIPFRQINNLIFLDLKVNDVNLTFLLDTGVSETLLFSLENKDIAFENVEKVKFTGLGGSDYIEGIKSTKNKIWVDRNFVDNNHEIYIILDENFNIINEINFPANKSSLLYLTKFKK